ncbi:MAG: enoyl-CoA hydratase-related protein [Ilumatobacteraceae bacterium]
MPYEHILFEIEDPVAVITLNRPDKLNAWTSTMAREVRDAVGLAERDPAVVGIVLTGAGKGFCAGADMNDLSGLSGADGGGGVSSEDDAVPFGDDLGPTPGDPTWSDELRGTYTFLMSVPKPVICAINGAVAGMGVPIALACDIRIMNETAVMTTSFAHRGLIAEWGVSWLLSRLVGPANALDLLFTARKVRGEEAARIGLVNRAVPAEDTLRTAVEYVQELAAMSSPTSLAIMKRQVYVDLHRGLGEAESEAITLMKLSFDRGDFAEGVSSFLERRPPAFPRYVRG